MSTPIELEIFRLYKKAFGKEAKSLLPLNGDGSDRLYFRVIGDESTAIAVQGCNRRENEAFVAFSRHFERFHLPVPHIFAYEPDNGLYLESDLGDVMLYDRMAACGNVMSRDVRNLYLQAIRMLPRFQIKAGRSLDFSKCFQTTVFDAEAMLRDLLYFQHVFLRRFAANRFDIDRLHDDFALLIRSLLDEPAEFFLYRDFQSRNIMVLQEQLYFIDYQSGRKGALQYDLASLVYDSNVRLPEDLGNELIEEYLCAVNQYLSVPPSRFMRSFYDFALIRVLQALAAFSFLGYDKQRIYFRSCIPRGLELLRKLLLKSPVGRQMRALPKIVEGLEATAVFDEEKRP
ncbi:MAG: phosphotransferase [candidate division KSB1 bacterium]|nr:phosphotransferase [candidate division KSB1 bacterium]